MISDLDQIFSDSAKGMKRSAIREILKLTQRPEIISFAGGLPSPESFPIEQLKEWGLSDGILQKAKYMQIKYFDEAFSVVAQRRRFGLGKGLFRWVKGSKTMLYGLWHMAKIREK